MAQFGTEYTIVIPHPASEEVLLLREEHGWTLPYFECGPPTLFAAVDEINRLLLERWQLRATTLRCLDFDWDAERKLILLSYAVECRDPRWCPPLNGRWTSREELDALLIPSVKGRAIFDDWFNWRDCAAVAGLRVPWYQSGWYTQAERWIHAQLALLGMTLSAPVEQLRTCQRSAILRAITDAGTLYFKALPDLFSHELPLTSALAQRFPANIPAIVAEDREQRWMLMREVSGQTLERYTDLETWANAVRRYAQLQIALVDEVELFRQIGCPDRRPAQIVAEVDALFTDRAALQPDDSPISFTDDEIEKLQTLAPELKRACARLAEAEIPCSLDHGDLWSAQMFVQEGETVFIDWSDSTITHPFFTLHLFLLKEELARFFAGNATAYERLRDAYLEPWTIYAPMERLRRALHAGASCRRPALCPALSAHFAAQF